MNTRSLVADVIFWFNTVTKSVTVLARGGKTFKITKADISVGRSKNMVSGVFLFLIALC